MKPEFAIGFDGDIVPRVLNEETVFTYRLYHPGDRYDTLNVGDEINARDSSTKKIFARLKITEKTITTFGELPLEMEGHEPYASKEEQRSVFEKFRGKPVKDSDNMIILGFQLIK